MVARDSNFANAYEGTSVVSWGPTDLTITVDSTTGAPASPCYLCVEPDSATQREYVYFDGTFTGTTFVTSVIGNRYLDGSAAASGLTHPIGSKVRAVPAAQMFEDLHDRIDGAVSTVGDTMSGELNMADNLLTRPEIKDWAETIETHVTPGTTETLDLANGNVQTITLDNATTTTLTFSNPPATGKAGAFTLIVTQSAAGTGLIGWPASVDWPAATAPTLTATASSVDVFTFLTTDGGTTWLGMTAGKAFA